MSPPDRDNLTAADAPHRRAHEHVLVRVGAERFALPLAGVQEAVTSPAIDEVPAMPSGCVGLLRWRGRRLPVHCPGAALGWPAARPVRVVLVVRGGSGPVAVAVDEVLDVVAIEPPWIRTVPGLRDPNRVLHGVTTASGELVAVLRPEALAAATAGCARIEAAS